MLIDTHCHLDFYKFDPDRAAVLGRAAQAGVTHILVPGLTLDSSLSALRLAESHPMLFSAVGVHPTEVANFNHSLLNELRNLMHNPKVKAIGEIGLDYYWDTASHDLQQGVLKAQLELAAEARLPVVIHFREKGDTQYGPCATDLLKILSKWIVSLRMDNNPLAEKPGVLHSFSGTEEAARQAIALNFCLGISGSVTYRKDRQEMIAFLPLERLLLETDAPFMTPAPHRGKRNEPAFIALIADKIAGCQSRTVQEVAEVTSTNARCLFSWE